MKSPRDTIGQKTKYTSSSLKEWKVEKKGAPEIEVVEHIWPTGIYQCDTGVSAFAFFL